MDAARARCIQSRARVERMADSGSNEATVEQEWRDDTPFGWMT
jgi:hypothetical protein